MYRRRVMFQVCLQITPINVFIDMIRGDEKMTLKSVANLFAQLAPTVRLTHYMRQILDHRNIVIYLKILKIIQHLLNLCNY